MADFEQQRKSPRNLLIRLHVLILVFSTPRLFGRLSRWTMSSHNGGYIHPKGEHCGHVFEHP